MLDLGAGIGIASEAFRRAGAARVIAVEPDASSEVGRGAMVRAGLEIEVVDAFSEALPLPDGSIDVAYSRQVLHHASDLPTLAAEIARVLRPGGIFLACGEHVVSDEHELALFLAAHPVHRLAGGEHAFRLDAYTSAIEGAGLRLRDVLGPWDTVINAFPAVRTTEALRSMARDRLVQRFGRFGAVLATIPGVQPIVRRRTQVLAPGRLYSFLAIKP